MKPLSCQPWVKKVPEETCGVVANVMDYDILAGEFELLSRPTNHH